MSNQGNFDAADAIRRQRAAEEAKKKREEAERRREQADLRRRHANAVKLFRYAEEQLENIRDPIVSEFVVIEKRPSEVGFFRKRTVYQQRKTRYSGSWLSLHWFVDTTGEEELNESMGLVKLCQPRAGYAHVDVKYEYYYDTSQDRHRADWTPRDVTHVTLRFDGSGREESERSRFLNHQHFRVFSSLEEAAELMQSREIQLLTWEVRRALDFVATGQPPDPRMTGPTPYGVD